MSTFANFFGCAQSTPNSQSRDLNDQQPINFSWSTQPTAIKAEVAFDNLNFVDTVGEVVDLGSQVFQLNYDPKDRPTNPGLITYRFTDDQNNTDTLQVEFIGEPIQHVATSHSYSKFGPKRVRTKEMDIEQFDPVTLQIAAEREASTTPTFCGTKKCVGVPLPPNEMERYDRNS